MSIFETVVLALIQGVAEFLPISSSAHLILPSQLFGWQDQGLAFDVAVHIGSLLAVVLYFRHDLLGLLNAWSKSVFSGSHTEQSRLGWLLILATLPAVIIGGLGKDAIEVYGRSSVVIAITTLLFGGLLWVADTRFSHHKTLMQLTWRAALFIGVAQAIALIPGTSRSGITITAALMLGFTRDSAARFSFLLSIPVILGSGLLKGLDLVDVAHVDWGSLILGACLSFLSAYLCINLFLSWINRVGMLPFVIYRLLLGSLLLGFSFL